MSRATETAHKIQSLSDAILAEVNTLPAGLTFAGSTLSGTPAQSGTFTFTITQAPGLGVLQGTPVMNGSARGTALIVFAVAIFSVALLLAR